MVGGVTPGKAHHSSGSAGVQHHTRSR
ncbi:hypothetical protein DMH17_10495 [Raoultella planticola]|nr:hypothetical protein [Raoultella planticola]